MLKPGDMVMLYHGEKAKYLVTLPEKGAFSTHRGNIPYSLVFEKDYGDTVKTHLGETYHLLKPTVADLQKKVKRTTTIVYPKEAGMMLVRTMVFPGARVIEVGSGSGALTSILANFVRPTGRVYSYESRADFSENAKHNVRSLGLLDWVDFKVRDVGESGTAPVFGEPKAGAVPYGFDEIAVDTVFIDVPEPWDIVPHAHKALKGGFPLVSLSPTVEQIRKTKTVMELVGFTRIKAVELLERELLVRPSGCRPVERMISHTGYLLFGHKLNVPQPPRPETSKQVRLASREHQERASEATRREVLRDIADDDRLCVDDEQTV
jgi:tRNA (adenine57-N1/adenine58-N1)-methyltransferase